MKKNKSNILFIGGIILCVIIILLVLFLIFGKKLKADSPIVKEAYSYLGTNDLQACGGLLNYQDKEVASKDLKKEEKICKAYSLIDTDKRATIKIDKSKKNNTCSLGDSVTFRTDDNEGDICTVTKLDAKSIKEQYENMYGEKLDNFESFQYDSTNICHYYEDNYYCGLSESFSISVGAEPHTYRAIKKSYEKGGELTIYDYFLKVVNDECYKTYNSTSADEKCSKNYNPKKEMEYSFLKKYGSLYKHTFKKGDNNKYYWVKSELEK